MRLSVIRVIVTLSLCLVSMGMFAQEKTLQYYNTHESEILPDARAAFRKGDYERTLELCRWHYIIFGDNTTDSLRERSERCAQLTKEMNDLQSEGNLKDAKLKASAILSLNPDDAAAKATLSIEEPVTPIPDTVVVEQPVKPVEEVILPPTEDRMDNTNVEQKPEEIQSPFEEVSSLPGATKPEQVQPYVPHSRFVVKAGASILDMKQLSQTIAPGGSIGLYDLGGSRIGGEIGASLCPGLSDSGVSFFEFDAGLVFRASKNVYPKLGVGFFSCKPADETFSTTTGLCADIGLNFLIGGHFCLEIGTKYYPEVCVQGSEMVSTTPGASYEFPSVKQILSGGIAPFVSLGWAF